MWHDGGLSMELNGLVIESMVVGSVGTNCYIVHRKEDDRCVVIDPGDSGERIGSYIRQHGLVLEDILLTHGHFDHVLGVPGLVADAGGRVCAYEGERELLSDAGLNVSGMTGRPVSIEADVVFRDGQKFESAGMEFQVIHTPGHTKGSCCYYIEKEKVLFCGDTLFFESVGRCDLPTGNERELIRSLREKILTLPQDVQAFTGHGPATQIGYESENNPFI